MRLFYHSINFGSNVFDLAPPPTQQADRKIHASWSLTFIPIYVFGVVPLTLAACTCLCVSLCGTINDDFYRQVNQDDGEEEPRRVGTGTVFPLMFVAAAALLVWFFLLVLRMDHAVRMSWFMVFIPIFFLTCLLTLTCCWCVPVAVVSVACRSCVGNAELRFHRVST